MTIINHRQNPDSELFPSPQSGKDAPADPEEKAVHAVFQMQYTELKKVAQRLVRERGRNPTLGATALVNELYLKWAASADSGVLNRATFFVTAAVAMQRIFISYKRHQNAAKRGGKALKVEFIDQAVVRNDSGAQTERDEADALQLALAKLKIAQPRQYQVAMLRHYLGMTNDEIAEVIRSSSKTVQRDWEKAKQSLAEALKKLSL